MNDPRSFPTPGEMAAVTGDSRLAALETRMSGAESRITAGETARQATDTRVTGINTKVDALTITVEEIKTMLKGISDNLATLASSAATVVKNPAVRQYGLQILGAIAVILTLLSTYLGTRLSAEPSKSAPAATPTIFYLPAPAAPTHDGGSQ